MLVTSQSAIMLQEMERDKFFMLRRAAGWKGALVSWVGIIVPRKKSSLCLDFWRDKRKYYTVLSKMDRQSSSLCSKCEREIRTYSHHYFWQCKRIKRFWDAISKELDVVFCIKISSGSGLLPPWSSIALTQSHFKLCDKLLLLARKCILMKTNHYIMVI